MIRYVDGGFQALVNQGRKICVSDKHTMKGNFPTDMDQTSIGFKLYSSSSPTARWTDSKYGIMSKIGEVEIPCVWGQCSSISVSFGDTEIMATATNTATGQVHIATIKYDFNSL
jgi:hypothetical protein